MIPQTIWIARHGNRIDFVNPEWFNTAERRYTTLSDDGVGASHQLGQRLKEKTLPIFLPHPSCEQCKPRIRLQKLSICQLNLSRV